MELLETQDPDKKRLIETSDRHKHELEMEVKAISENTERMVKNAVIIGGTLAITYLIVSSLSSSGKKKVSRTSKVDLKQISDDDSATTSYSYTPPTIFSQISERIASQATAFLLELAKDKLNEYLSNRRVRNENS